jgi:hypothetical protein
VILLIVYSAKIHLQNSPNLLLSKQKNLQGNVFCFVLIAFGAAVENIVLYFFYGLVIFIYGDQS